MNKAIYICAAAAMMLGSCSNDETVEFAKENAISFRSVVGLNTRALNMTQDTLERKGMYVTTFTKDGARLYPETHYELTEGVWVATPAQSWGGYSELNFFLTYPKLDEWQGGAELDGDQQDGHRHREREYPRAKGLRGGQRDGKQDRRCREREPEARALVRRDSGEEHQRSLHVQGERNPSQWGEQSGSRGFIQTDSFLGFGNSPKLRIEV